MKTLISLHSVWLLSAVDYFALARCFARRYKAENGPARTSYESRRLIAKIEGRAS